ncbi:DUF5696 domain-containing protein [Paenibacillus sp. PAMC21692]|uniref:DUF5696 domain-containing protein n=1 Tax=Paenibacillus sp. PAMC21692 TaxID=2762320 RepID=UPI00164D262B|nr:DUF5696 domain-containing protein [Paenibacillus sp. PAMC21692]QNK57263.1 hypothetical protein H7F31_33115 [Paenibacillus sp. PAMC21692]
MVKRLRMTKRRWLLLAVVLAVLAAAMLMLLPGKPSPTLDEIGLSKQSDARLALLPAAGGLPGRGQQDGEGFLPVLENARFRLWLQPELSQIAVEEMATGKRWRSNPPESALEGESVKGLLLANLKSPFLLEYTKDGKTQREVTNAADKNLKMAYTVENDILQVNYSVANLGLGVALQYKLTDHGLVAAVPAEGITETSDRRILSLSLLPFFGAASQSSKDGYLFVPDGPGGLIYFDRVRTIAEGKRYSQPIYGFETANRMGSESMREMISYPVFGLKDGDQAFAAIISSGEMTANIEGMPSGEVSTFHSIYPEFIYRQEYGQRMSRLSAPVVMIQKDRVMQDRVVEYRLLSDSEAGYVGMAHAYRGYLQETGQLGEPLQPAHEVPLELALLGGDSRPTSFGTSFVPVTTFGQAEEIVARLQEIGIGNMRVTYAGWLEDGTRKTNSDFTIEPKLGGKSGLQGLAAKLRQSGVETFRLEADLVWMDSSRSGALTREEGIRSIDGTVYYNAWDWFVLNPSYGVRQAMQWWEEMSGLGVNGIHFEEMGRRVFRDYNNSEIIEREDTAALYTSLFNKLREQSANVSVRRANAYTLSGIDHFGNMPLSSSYDFILDESVPFYPIALHGYMTYSGPPGNMRDMYKEEQLKAIEYGAVPFFLLTYDPPRSLTNTGTWVFSSEYRLWEERIKQELEMFRQLAPVQHLTIADHKRLRDGVYVTVYEDGTEVEVNYGSGTFEVRRGSGP